MFVILIQMQPCFQYVEEVEIQAEHDHRQYVGRNTCDQIMHKNQNEWQ